MYRWLRSYVLMLKWQALSNKPMIPFYVVVEIMFAVGFVIGIGFFYPQINPTIAKFLTTGAPTLILLMLGLVIAPQVIVNARLEGTFDYIWSLPVPRMVYLVADATIWVLITLPGVLLALVIGSLYHSFTLEVSPLVVPALLLIAMTGIFVGYTFAFGAPKPQMAQVATQIITFAIVTFSPIMYPVEHLPDWLAAVHRVLPIQYMADLSRGTLTDLDVNLGLAFGITSAWCIAGFVVTYFIIRRRH